MGLMHERSQDFFFWGGEHFFKIFFKKYSNNSQKIFKKYSKKFQNFFKKIAKNTLF